MKQVELKYYVEVDTYAMEENYYGEIVSSNDNKILFDHITNLKSFAFKEDMVFDLVKKCAEYGYEVVNIVDETYAPSFWEEQI